MYKLITILLLTSLSIANANSGFALLKMDVVPRSAALAGCEYLSSTSLHPLNYNPAALYSKNLTVFTAGYSKFLEDGQTGFIGVGKDTGYGSAGLEISWINLDNLDGREVPSEEAQYQFNAGFIDIAAGYAYPITENIHLGIAGKYLTEKIEFETADGYALSGGIKISHLLPNLTLAVAGNNFGAMGELNICATPLPSSLETGAGYDYTIADFKATAAIRDIYLTEDKENLVNCGLELSYANRIFMRGGYRFNNEGLPFSAGLGINYNGLCFDYAFSSFADDFGQIHSFALSYSLR